MILSVKVLYTQISISCPMYKIPKDGKVILAIRNVLARYRNINSQRRFKELVERELNQGREEYRVSGTRIRKLAIISGIAHIEVHTRGNGGEKTDSTCPVCGSELKQSKNMTVYGDEVTWIHSAEARRWRGCLRVPEQGN